MSTTDAALDPREVQAAANAADEISSAELDAHRASTRSDIQAIAADLNPVFGRDLLAIMTGVQNPRTVTQWVRGESEPHPGTARVLRDVAYVAMFLLGSGKAEGTVQAWFVGMNPHLRGQSPSEMIGKDPRRVLSAAKAFVLYA